MESTIFSPGPRVKLIAMSSIRTKLVTTLVGYEIDKYIIIGQPTLKGVAARMAEGTDWSVNFIHEGDIYIFNSFVIGNSRLPFPLTFMSYPKKIDRSSLRAGKRFPVHIRASYTRDGAAAGDPNEPAFGVIIDISEGGCLFKTAFPYRVGELMNLTMSISRNEKLEGIKAEIKNSREVSNGIYLVGLKFIFDLTGENNGKLREMVALMNSLPLKG